MNAHQETNKHSNKSIKKGFLLAASAIALLLIPRRSSQKANHGIHTQSRTDKHAIGGEKTNNNKAEDDSNH